MNLNEVLNQVVEIAKEYVKITMMYSKVKYVTQLCLATNKPKEKVLIVSREKEKVKSNRQEKKEVQLNTILKQMTRKECEDLEKMIDEMYEKKGVCFSNKLIFEESFTYRFLKDSIKSAKQKNLTAGQQTLF